MRCGGVVGRVLVVSACLFAACGVDSGESGLASEPDGPEVSADSVDASSSDRATSGERGQGGEADADDRAGDESDDNADSADVDSAPSNGTDGSTGGNTDPTASTDPAAPSSSSSTSPASSAKPSEVVASTTTRPATTAAADTGTVEPPRNVTVTVEGPDIMIRWEASPTAGRDIQYLTYVRPVGDSPDFRSLPWRHRNHLRSDRIRNAPRGTYDIEVWAARIEGEGAAAVTLATSASVTRRVTIDDRDAVELRSITISDLLHDELNNRDYLVLSLQANKCVFLDVTGSTRLRTPDFHAEQCLSEIRTELDPVGPGNHAITITATDRDGATTSERVSFEVGAQRDPCRLADPVPDPWRVKVGETTTLDLRLTGDCGEVDWRFSDWAHPGFTMNGSVLTANPTGPPRGELINMGVGPARSEAFGFRINIIVYSDDTPDVVPCTMEVDRGLISNGTIRLRVAVGETVSTRIAAAGDCDPYRWELNPTSIPGVTFQNEQLTVTGEGPPRSVEFRVSLLPENGTRWAQPVLVEIVG